MSELTPKQARFVREYLIDLNATQAAIRTGYSEKGADTAGPRLLENPEIIAAIDAAKIERSEKTEITAERVLKEIATMALYDPGDLVGVLRELDGDEPLEGEGIVAIDGKRYAISGITSAVDILKLPESVRRAIVGWGYDRNQNFTLKLADKSKALDQLARHLSLYNDKLELGGLDALADRLVRANNGRCKIQHPPQSSSRHQPRRLRRNRPLNRSLGLRLNRRSHLPSRPILTYRRSRRPSGPHRPIATTKTKRTGF
ncbi:terminase small subunit [Mesorhizobium sp.]|uniref:terminase small subunit n=1 Tax=Mesorhizobium sp. TaxID=1871066 RepID=UPI000FE78725|nr:terminase small subunit [Mesorhizobium sp.]RWA97331.1 MAG: terminase small subunit [Mesorhizobium sp.]